MTNIENIQYFIGIDISKKTLDIAILHKKELVLQETILNTKKGLGSFFVKLKKAGIPLRESIICAEFTGVYTNHLINFSLEKSLNLWMENAYHIKQSQGLKRGKNDKIDAVRIANYSYRNKQDYKGFKAPRTIIKSLKVLVNQRRKLVAIKKQITASIGEKQFRLSYENKTLKSCSLNTLKGLDKDLKVLETKMMHLIRSDEQLFRQYKIVTSVDAVGAIVGINMIVMTNEFKDISEAKKFACYSGVVPFRYTSGTSVNSKSKVSKMANHDMKTLLHMAALSSLSIKGDLQDFFHRKVAEGKNKMAVINAIRNKIVLRVFACIKNNRMYQKNYDYSLVKP
mgnify:CR=1 FL=1